MEVPNKDQEPTKRPQWVKYAGVIAAATVGGAVAVTVGAPFVVGAVGFSSGGIVAGSLAAKAMSIAATSGWGMGAVGMAQSVGAAGVGAATTVAGGAVSGGVYAAAHGFRGGKQDEKTDNAELNKDTQPEDSKQLTNGTDQIGIVAGSLAAKVMNIKTATSGWGMIAVAKTQSVGAAGFGAATTVAGAFTTVSGKVYSAAQGFKGGKQDNKQDDAVQTKSDKFTEDAHRIENKKESVKEENL